MMMIKTNLLSGMMMIKLNFLSCIINIIFFEWYDGYQKHKAQEAQIKEEFLPIAWHPNCLIDWYMLEDEKRLWK